MDDETESYEYVLHGRAYVVRTCRRRRPYFHIRTTTTTTTTTHERVMVVGGFDNRTFNPRRPPRLWAVISVSPFTRCLG